MVHGSPLACPPGIHLARHTLRWGDECLDHLTGVKGTAPRCKAPLHATSNPPSHECPSIFTQSTRRFIDSMVDRKGAGHRFLSQLCSALTDVECLSNPFYFVVIADTHRNSR